MSFVTEKILALHTQLLPTGRAFRMRGDREKLFSAITNVEATAYENAISFLDSLIPDNDRFTSQDATDWERRLGLITNLSVSLSDRKKAILRKMSFPEPNGNYLYIQQQLRTAGFDVYVYENRFASYPTSYEPENPATINPAILSERMHGEFQHGDGQSHYFNNIVVNSIDNAQDILFNLGNNLNFTFFIGGATLGTYANVSAARETEFRQTILQIKQVRHAAILYVNYV
jgi:hypothetical protein